MESYEVAAYFYARHVDLQNCALPFFFVTGDELMYDHLEQSVIKRIFGENEIEQKFLESKDVWGDLKKMYNVFYLHKYYYNEEWNTRSLAQWSANLGSERVLQMNTPKACVDVMLGAIAITSGKRNLEEYVKDMRDRGQDKDRIKEVVGALQEYATYMTPDKIVRGKAAGKI